MSEPIVVFYKSNECSHCTALTNIWSQVQTEIRKVKPNIRFFTLTAKDMGGAFDEKIAPKDMIRYSRWFPMILLIPGKLWDMAMNNISSKEQTIQLTEGVQIMNGKMEKGQIQYEGKYNIRQPSEFKRWIEDSFKNPDFERVNNGRSVIVPTMINQNTENSTSLTKVRQNFNIAGDNEAFKNVCTMRIIPRQK